MVPFSMIVCILKAPISQTTKEDHDVRACRTTGFVDATPASALANAPLAEMMLPSIDEIIRAFAIDWWDLPTPLDGGSWGGGGGGKGH